MRDHAADWDALKATDPEVAEAIANELERERTTLRLIASENYASPAVLAAMGSTMTNKYAEGYPGRRYYGGCEFVDVAESLAISRAKALFGAEHANVQPHSGAQANMTVYLALLKPGDTVLGMNLSHGGHLTHGHPLNFSGKLYTIVPYGVRKDTERIDLDQVRDLARERRPKLIIAGGSAFPRAIDFKPFREIADEVGALLMADIAHPAGLVVAGLPGFPMIARLAFLVGIPALRLRGLAFAIEHRIGYIIGAYGYDDTPGDIGKFTLVLHREPGEPWLIFSDMDNSDAPPQPQAAPDPTLPTAPPEGAY